MNTTQKGNQLEEAVYHHLQLIVDEGKVFGVYSRLRHHKKYPADVGEKVLDVSIDQYLTKEDMEKDDPYHTIIFECKNYKNPLNTSSYEEWIGKLERLGKFRYKLFIVTTVGFSGPTIESARQKGIGLIKMPLDGKPEIILRRSINDISRDQIYFEQLQNNEKTDDIITYDENHFSSLLDTLSHYRVGIKKEYRLEAPYYRKQDIERITNSLIYNARDSKQDILDYLLEVNQDITIFDNQEIGDETLGRFDIDSKTIMINQSLDKNSPRYRFTLAHEFGHYYLHYEKTKNKINTFGDNQDSLTLFIGRDNEKWFEYHANTFASQILLPKDTTIKCALRYFRKYDINRGRLYVDMQPCNISNYNNIIPQMAGELKVSQQALSYRLMELKLLEFNSNDQKYYL